MKSLRDKLGALRDEAHKHVNWLVGSLFGDDALTKDERASLSSGMRPVKLQPVDVSRTGFLLGRTKAVKGDRAYDRLSSFDDDMPLDDADSLAVAAAQIHGARYLRNVAIDIVDGAFAELESRLSRTMTESLVQGSVAKEVSESVLLKETVDQLSTRLEAIFGKDAKKRILRIATSELHAAKQQGIATSVLMGRGPYANYGGPDARVIVVASKGACRDCLDLYYKDGEPRVFRLGDLMSRRSNGEPGTSHKKVKGKHVDWVATVPPLHPSCFCEIKFVPPGATWRDGRFVIEKSLLESEDLVKARYGGVGGTISSKVKPKGPGHAKKERGTGSMKGTPGLGHSAGPGRPKASAASSPVSVAVELDKYVECPYGGGRRCIDANGNGEPQHLTGGRIMDLHAEYAKTDAPQSDRDVGAESASSTWSLLKRRQRRILAKLDEASVKSHIVITSRDSDAAASVHLVALDGGGRALVMGDGPATTPRDGAGCGIGTVPLNGMARREVAAFKLSEALGFGVVPPSVLRPYLGQECSFQHVIEDALVLAPEAAASESPTIYDAALNVGLPSNRDQRSVDLHKIALLDALLNSQNRTSSSLIVTEYGANVFAIGNRYGFGNGMFAHSNPLLLALSSRGRAFSPPEHLMKRMAATSFGDVQRALGDTLQPWEVMQTFLRLRYLVMLYAAHKSLPKECFLPSACMADGTEVPIFLPHKDHVLGWPGTSSKDRIAAFSRAVRAYETPGALFMRFASAFVTTVMRDPSHPDYAAAYAIFKARPIQSPQVIESGSTLAPGLPFDTDSIHYDLIKMEPM